MGGSRGVRVLGEGLLGGGRVVLDPWIGLVGWRSCSVGSWDRS